MVPLRRHHVLTSRVTLFGAAASYRYRCLYSLSRGDLAWALLGSSAVRIGSVATLAFPLYALLAPAQDVGARISHIAIALFFCGLVPVLSVAVLMTSVGLGRLLDLPINIHIDGTGIEGWPFWPDLDHTWESIKAARRLRGVITLPFPDPLGLRRGWVVIPERALSQQQRVEFNELLESRGLLKPSR